MQSQSLVGTTQEIKKKYIPELGSDYPISTQVYDNNTNSILMVSHSEIELGNVYRVRYLQGQVTGFNKPHSGYFKVSRDFIDTKWTSKVDWNLDQQTQEYGAINDNFKSWVITKSYFDLGHLYPDVVIGQITWKPAPKEDQTDDDDDNGLFFRDGFNTRTPYIITIQLGNDVTEYEPSTSLELTVTIKDDIWGIQASLSSRMEASIRNNTQNVPLNGDKQIAIGNTIYLRRDEGTTDEVGVIYLLGEKWTPELQFLDQSYEGWVHYEEQPENLTPPGKDFSVDFTDSYLEITKNNYRTVDISRAVKPVANNIPTSPEGPPLPNSPDGPNSPETPESIDSPVYEPNIEESEDGNVGVESPLNSETVRIPPQDLDLGDQPGIPVVNEDGELVILPPPSPNNLITINENGDWVEYTQENLAQSISNLLSITFADSNPTERTVYSSGYIDNLQLGLPEDEIRDLLFTEVPRIYREYVAINPIRTPKVYTSYVRIGPQQDVNDIDAALFVMNTTITEPRGFLPPRLSEFHRNRINTLKEGLTVYNTTTKQYEYYNGNSWNPIGSNSNPLLNSEIINQSLTLTDSGYFFVDCSQQSIDITLPDVIQDGKTVDFIDLRGTILSTGATGFGLHNLNIIPNSGQTIQGQSDSIVLDKDNEVIGLAYIAGDWRIYRRAQTGTYTYESNAINNQLGQQYIPISANLLLIANTSYSNKHTQDVTVWLPDNPNQGDTITIVNYSEVSDVIVNTNSSSHTITGGDRIYKYIYLNSKWSITLIGSDEGYLT